MLGKYFSSVLYFLRTREVEVNETIDLNCLLLEAKYYGINGMIAKIQEKIQAREDKENQKLTRFEFCCHMIQLNNQIMQLTSTIDKIRSEPNESD